MVPQLAGQRETLAERWPEDREKEEEREANQGLFSHCSRGGDVCGKGSP